MSLAKALETKTARLGILPGGISVFENVEDLTDLAAINAAQLLTGTVARLADGSQYRFNSALTVGGVAALGGGRWMPLFAQTADGVINVKAYGAVGDGATDDRAAIVAAIAAAVAMPQYGGKVFFPPGTYLVTDTITIADNRISLQGSGLYTTTILFAPTAEKVLFHFTTGINAVLYQNSLRDMSFTGSGALKKTGIRATDTSEFAVKNVSFNTWTGADSIGILLEGRELTIIDQVDIFADKPIVIADNPNSTIDSDHLTLTNTYLAAQVAANSCVEMSAANVTNFVVNGYNAWIAGTNGLLKATVGTSQNWNLQNIRWEQQAATTGFVFSVATAVQFCTLINVAAGSGANGFKLRGCNVITLIGCSFENNSGRVAIDADGTNDQISLIGNFFQVGSINTIAGLEQVLRLGDHGGQVGHSSFEFYYQSANVERVVQIFGNNNWQKNFLLAAGAGSRYVIPMLGNQKSAIVTIGAYSATGPVEECGVWLVTAASAILLSGTANVGVGNLANKLTLFFENVSTISVFNQLAGAPAVYLTVDVKWSTA